MAEVLFYHLQNRTVEAVLPGLLERSLERGWRVVVQAATDERIEALDALLWTYREDSFLPHATARESDAPDHPILLTLGGDNPNRAQVRFLIDEVGLPVDVHDYERLVLLFDGADPDAVAAARAAWQSAKAQGCDVTYWQQNGHGRWERKA